jgi:hypothetical protein
MTVGRFQVMALLQAARASELGLPLESALSWGLTKAIFYAAAKRGFKGHSAKAAAGGGQSHPPLRATPDAAKSHHEEYRLGDDMAYRDEGSPNFVIGGKVQTKQDFERQVEVRFQGHFREAWKEALDYVRRFPRETLLSGNGFYSEVYRPRRDELAEKWSEMSQISASPRRTSDVARGGTNSSTRRKNKRKAPDNPLGQLRTQKSIRQRGTS